ncbi:CHAP domain-containing protein [Leuconostoc pseudomesenteroides]|uniref:CHAP domain-containing protein n=1 Tax=Leuconostoc pseudomesenteroides TaxID=33968 RepID=UPI0040367568
MRKIRLLLLSIIGFLTLIVYSNNVSAATTPYISYQTQVQNIGWQGWVSNGSTAGTTGQSLRLEAFKLELQNNGYNGSVTYRAHVQNIGWQNWQQDDTVAGTVGQGLRVEAFQINLSGDISTKFDVQYRAYVQNIGWQNWTSNGNTAGTVGQGLRVEAMQVQLVPKSSTPTNYPHPQAGGTNTYPYGYCTYGVKEMASWIGNNWGNASEWANSARKAGYVVNSTPEVGSVVVFQNGQGGANSPAGHTALVIGVNGNSITVREMNFTDGSGAGGFGKYSTRTIGNASSYQYIH